MSVIFMFLISLFFGFDGRVIKDKLAHLVLQGHLGPLDQEDLLGTQGGTAPAAPLESR